MYIIPVINLMNYDSSPVCHSSVSSLKLQTPRFESATNAPRKLSGGEGRLHRLWNGVFLSRGCNRVNL